MESCVGKNDDGSNFGQGEPTPFEYDHGRTSPVATCRTPRPSGRDGDTAGCGICICLYVRRPY